LLANRVENETGEIFCCRGCLDVHALLGDKGWGQVYDLLDQSGKTLPQARIQNDYRAFLNSIRSPHALEGVGMRSENRHTVHLESRDIQCAACGFLLENLLCENPAVLAFEVDFIHGEIALTYDEDKAHLADILAALAAFGFRYRPRDPKMPGPKRGDRGLLLRLTVAGACFANAMAFSLANYFGLWGSIDPYWSRAFGWLAFAAAIPAALYGSHPFYLGAYRAIKARVFTLDLSLSVGITLTLLVSLAALWRGKPEESYADSLAGLIFFLLLGRWSIQRLESSLVLRSRWFDVLRKSKVWVLRGGEFRSESLDGVAPGDLIRVLPGEYSPCDGILRDDTATVETSVLSGESRPCRLQAGDPIFAGSRVETVAATLTVSATPGQSRVARLLDKLSQLQAKKSAAPRKMEKVALVFTAVVVVAAIAALGLHYREGWRHALLVSASVFIISCSCALALAVPISRGLGLKRALALGFHFRSQDSLEKIARVRLVLFDKTGTLSYAHRKLQSWTWTAAASESREQARLSAHIVALCRHSHHPVALSLVEALSSTSAAPERDVAEAEPLSLVKEIPHAGLVGEFSQGRHALTVVRLGIWRDAAYSGQELKLPAADECERQLSGLGRSSHTPSCSAIFWDSRLVAVAELKEEIRPEVPAMVARLKGMGIGTALLSGDHPDRVAAFAKDCGFDAFEGGLSPEEKQGRARALKKAGGLTLAVGDGFNDSLLLGEADISMAVAGDLPMVAEGADILSTGESPADLLGLLAIAAGVRRSLKISYAVSGVYNALAISVALLGWVHPLLAAVLMPLSSLTLGLSAFFAIPRQSRVSA